MSTAPTQTHPEFVFVFLAVRRADVHAIPHRETVVAPNERSARRALVRDYMLSFAGRLPVTGAHHD